MRLAHVLGPDVEEILRDDPGALREGLADFHPAEVTDLLEELSREDRVRVLENLSEEQVGAVLSYLSGRTLFLALTRLDHSFLARALDSLEPDDAANLLSIIPEEKRLPVLELMSAGDAAAARGLLRYDPGTAGRLMTDKFVRVRPEWTVRDALDHLRQIDPEVATVADLYAVDEEGRLVGVLSLRRLLPQQERRTIASLMTRELIYVGPDASQDEVAALVSKYGFNALPVVDDEERILGIITVDDVIDVLVTRETQSALRLGGVVGTAETDRSSLDYFGSSLLHVVKRRIGWLLLLFIAATLTGNVLRHFDQELSQVVALSFFIPLIIGTGGNAGSQTVSTIIRALALGQVRRRDVFRVIVRESQSGLLLGTLLCLFSFARVMLWGMGADLALVVGLTILVVCAWSNVVAALVPLAADKFGIDPTLVSAPLITTVVDATGLGIYMLIAKTILQI
jgi:magnesium transporter